MSDCQYLIAEKEHKCFVKLIGRSDYMSCGNFKEFVDDLVEHKRYNDIFIDLTELEFIDSTNLGIIAKFTDYMISNFRRKAVIYSTNQNINQIIKSVGFFDAFTVLDSTFEDDIGLMEIKNSEKLDGSRLSRILLEAHKTLLDLNEHNREIFSDVVKCLINKEKAEGRNDV